ncbi:hypothetical protein SAMN04488136_12283 [Vibrio xiamenensis]|uniref:Cation transporter n=1 Tax=Vibrio xiamenensis TaxID=861298 RepID=A0A1G8E1Z3_9VIBR|nr:hypothetical protein [Vibrio xiamenensis]SDH63956.1 hypothetical protein SAMN04488136_12283 [Vibrio xiamenensis]
MERDVFGICLSTSMLSRNLSSTFTHVRAYEAGDDVEVKVKHTFPQLSGEQVLESMSQRDDLIWRAEFCCRFDK